LNYLFWDIFHKKWHGALKYISPLIIGEAEHTHESQLGATAPDGMSGLCEAEAPTTSKHAFVLKHKSGK